MFVTVPLTVREEQVNKPFTLAVKRPLPVGRFDETLLIESVSVPQRNDDEAVVDRGGTRSQQRTNFEQEDLEGTLPDTQSH